MEDSSAWVLTELSVYSVSELGTRYEAGDAVETEDGSTGVVLEVREKDVKWPVGDVGTDDVDTETVKGSERRPLYLVGIADGGTELYRASALSKRDIDEAFDVDEDKADPEVVAEEMGHVDAEELVNVPGVKDPHVGFEHMPESWRESEEPARSILLRAWVSAGASWESAYREFRSSGMSKRKAKRMASAMKDEVYGTTRWRAFDD